MTEKINFTTLNDVIGRHTHAEAGYDPDWWEINEIVTKVRLADVAFRKELLQLASDMEKGPEAALRFAATRLRNIVG